MSSLGDRLVRPTVSCKCKQAVMDTSFLFARKYRLVTLERK